MDVAAAGQRLMALCQHLHQLLQPQGMWVSLYRATAGWLTTGHYLYPPSASEGGRAPSLGAQEGPTPATGRPGEAGREGVLLSVWEALTKPFVSGTPGARCCYRCHQNMHAA
jgi:hypothetical protein